MSTLANGEYELTIEMSGGTGRASVESPTTLIVEDGTDYVVIVWSSSSYDYMIVENEKYLNESEPGEHSQFTIPISEFDEPVTVIADTTAMSVPHEIEYQMIFHTDALNSGFGMGKSLVIAGIVLISAVFILFMYKLYRKRKSNLI